MRRCALFYPRQPDSQEHWARHAIVPKTGGEARRVSCTNHPSPITNHASRQMDWWWAYLAVGVFVGFFSGLLGIGGGAAMVPLLAFIFAAKGFAAQYTVHLALGTCVAAIMFTAVSSVRSHHRH